METFCPLPIVYKPKTLASVTDMVVTAKYEPERMVMRLELTGWSRRMLEGISRITKDAESAYHRGDLSDAQGTILADRVERAINWLINRGTITIK